MNMDGNAATALINARIQAVRAERDGTTDQTKRAAALEAIEGLQAARAEIIVSEADALGPLVDQLADQLEEIRTRYGLDAVSALGRTIDRLRGADAGTGDG
jgi:hypothetical protein